MARTRAKDHDEKRAEIMRVAARTFAESGYHGASMSALARACGVSKALIYHYYDSKEALLLDIIESHLNDLIEAVEAADPGDGPPDVRVRALVGALLDAYKDADAEHKVQINAMSALPEDYQSRLRELERQLVLLFSDAIRELNPALFEGKPLLKPVTMSLFGMLNWLFMWFRDRGPVSREEYAELATNLLVNGVRSLD
ncbi:TetR/AcrR family transcriptional regulator [Microbaculum marinum]|uniref:TetR/AcrR family transcriptional regulator n=1 Tax=Microbaculum marinum TaxID=1764581 RepID=A0AAW9RVV7_9HYPH